jgi:predicted nuclease of predicted toxin-antitoxin system
LVVLKIKVDEDLPSETAAVLRAAGHDATSVLEQGWGGKTDAELWRDLQVDQRWLMTADKGFSNPHSYHPSRQCGIILLRAPRESRAAYGALVRSLVGTSALQDATASVVVVTPSGIRIHRPETPEG